MKIEGTIESIVDTKNKEFKTVTIDGTRYGCKTKMVEKLGVGASVNAVVEKEGNFWNITSIEEFTKRGDWENAPSKDLVIVRECASYAASRIYAGFSPAETELERVIAAAKRFEKYIMEGK